MADLLKRSFLRERCKLCDDPAEMHVLYTEPAVQYKSPYKGDQELTMLYSHPSAITDPPLCYYHTKQIEGYFDCKYPLVKHGTPQQQRTLLKVELLKRLRLIAV